MNIASLTLSACFEYYFFGGIFMFFVGIVTGIGIGALLFNLGDKK